MRKMFAGESQPSNGLAFPQIPAVRRFFASAGQRQTALVCGYENKKCQDSLRKKAILHRCWYQRSAKVYERRTK